MAYSTIGWRNRVTQKQRTYTETTNQDGSKTFTPVTGTVISQGTPLSAENLGHMDQGIFDNDAAITEIKNRIAATPVVVPGAVTGLSIVGTGKQTVHIDFPVEFTEKPVSVIAGLGINSDTNPSGIGRISVAVAPSSITKTGCDVIIYSDATNGHNGTIYYLACGIIDPE